MIPPAYVSPHRRNQESYIGHDTQHGSLKDEHLHWARGRRHSHLGIQNHDPLNADDQYHSKDWAEIRQPGGDVVGHLPRAVLAQG